MKHVKLFEEYLNELDYGKLLFADPAYVSSSGRYKKLATDMYGDEREKDTDEERNLWARIKDHLKNNDKKIALNKKDFNTLLKMKKKFPDMLDPSTEIKPNDMIWRGQSASVNQVVDWIENAKTVDWFKFGDHDYVSNEFIALDIKKEVKSRNDNGFVSVSQLWDLAGSFAGFTHHQNRWPITVGTQFKNVANKAILAPDFAATMSGYKESETWIIGNSIPATTILVKSPATEFGSKIFTKGRIMVTKALLKRGVEAVNQLDVDEV